MSKRRKPRKPKCKGSNTGKLKPDDITLIKQRIREKARQDKKNEKDEFLKKAKEYVARRRAEIDEAFKAQRQNVSAPAMSNTSAEAVRENPNLLERLNAQAEKRGCCIFLIAMVMSQFLGLGLIVWGFNFLSEFLARKS